MPSYSLDFSVGFFVAYIMTVFITALYIGYAAMAEEDFTFCGFGSLTALHSMWVAIPTLF